MAKKLKKLIQDIEKFLSDYDAMKTGDPARATRELDRLLCYAQKWLSYFQHERLIHLIVTVLFAVCSIMVFGFFVITQQIFLLPLFGLMLVLLVPYIVHYFHLENGVQRLYDLIDELEKRKE